MAPIPAFPRERGKEQSQAPHFPFSRVRGKAGMGAR